MATEISLRKDFVSVCPECGAGGVPVPKAECAATPLSFSFAGNFCNCSCSPRTDLHTKLQVQEKFAGWAACADVSENDGKVKRRESGMKKLE